MGGGQQGEEGGIKPTREAPAVEENSRGDICALIVRANGGGILYPDRKPDWPEGGCQGSGRIPESEATGSGQRWCLSPALRYPSDPRPWPAGLFWAVASLGRAAPTGARLSHHFPDYISAFSSPYRLDTPFQPLLSQCYSGCPRRQNGLSFRSLSPLGSLLPR